MKKAYVTHVGLPVAAQLIRKIKAGQTPKEPVTQLIECLGYDFSSKVDTMNGGVLIPHHNGDISIELITGSGSWVVKEGVLCIETSGANEASELLLNSLLAQKIQGTLIISGRKIRLIEGKRSEYHFGVSVDQEDLDSWKRDHGINASTRYIEVDTPRAYLESHMPMASAA